MKVRDLLELLLETSKKYNTSTPCIVGGLPRDKVLGLIKTELSDIDLTTGDATVGILAKEFNMALQKEMTTTYKVAEDGHASIHLKGLKLDFSSNFNVPNITEILNKKGIQNPTDLQKELFSRDFTCNTLIMTLDFSKIKDFTKMAIPDIKAKKIRTCLDPDVTLKYNVNRIIRVVYLSAKLNFEVEQDIIDWVKNNPQYISQIKRSYLSKNINKAIDLDPRRAVDLINKMNMWTYIPITEKLYPYYKEMQREL